MSCDLKLLIEASNIRAGGGVSHLVEFLSNASPEKYNFSTVEVWGPKNTLEKIPHRPWLVLKTHPYIQKGYIYKWFWRRFIFGKKLNKKKSIIFNVGSNKIYVDIPYVSFCQNQLPFEFRELKRFGFSLTTLKFLFLRFYQCNVFKKASGVIFLTEYSSNVLKKIIPSVEAKSTVIPHGINPSFFYKRKRIVSNTKGEFKLLYLSIIDMYKHQWQVCKAIHNLRKKGLNITIDLVGPAYPPALKRLNTVLSSNQEYKNFVTYHGKVSYQATVNFYHNADAFIFASTCETFGMILLEAMASGLPIACSSYSSLPETLRDAGLYFDPLIVGEIESSIETLYYNEKIRYELSSKAFLYAQEYNWEATCNQTFEYLRKIAQENL